MFLNCFKHSEGLDSGCLICFKRFCRPIDRQGREEEDVEEEDTIYAESKKSSSGQTSSGETSSGETSSGESEDLTEESSSTSSGEGSVDTLVDIKEIPKDYFEESISSSALVTILVTAPSEVEEEVKDKLCLEEQLFIEAETEAKVELIKGFNTQPKEEEKFEGTAITIHLKSEEEADREVQGILEGEGGRQIRERIQQEEEEIALEEILRVLDDIEEGEEGEEVQGKANTNLCLFKCIAYSYKRLGCLHHKPTRK